jgi:hypothetical protein
MSINDKKRMSGFSWRIHKLTPAQIAVLRQAIADGGEIIMSGMDCTEPRPRRDVVERLAALGLVKYAASSQTGFGIGINDYLRITDAGRKIVFGASP